MSSTTRLIPRIRLPAPSRCDEALRLLADAGASPRQMLWGLWWFHTLPSVCKSLAAVTCAGVLGRLLAHFLA